MAGESKKTARGALTGTVLAVLGVLGALGASVYALRTDGSAPPSVVTDLAPLSDGVRFKLPVSMAQPSRGPKHSGVVITEWCDVVGQACREQALVIDEALKAQPAVRHIFRHLPQGTDVSMRTHELARYAFEHAGKFWEARELLLQREEPLADQDVATFQQALALDPEAVRIALERHSGGGYVAADTLFAGRFAVDQGSIFVNGRRLLPPLTAARLTRLVNEELERDKALAAQGIAPEQRYDESVKGGLWDAKGTVASTE